MRVTRLAVALALLAGGCTGTTRPARPVGCAVDLRPAERTLPDAEFVDVAAGTVSCFGERQRCLEEIRKQACIVGADIVYAFTESQGGGFTNVEARYAARRDARTGAR